jgi:5-formyltetrahydrofolate cyclo-ligase
MATKESVLAAAEAKRWLRRVAVKNRQSIRLADQRDRSHAIVQRVLKSPDFKKAKTVATFIGFASEVITDGLIEACWKAGKNVVVPMTSKGFDQPFFVAFSKGDKLTRSKHGPMELVTQKKAFRFGSIDLVLVPGLAFDRRGHRLGYGGGVYDRMLTKTPRAKHVGLFFSNQELHRVPTESHDRPLHKIITD